MNSSSSSSSSLLLTLYASVLVPVYSEWISKEDLCFLDTAVSSQELRKRFLEMLTYCSVIDEVKESDSSLSWIALRSLRVRKLQVTYWTPVCDSVIRSKRVSCLRIGLETLSHHLDCIKMNVPIIAGYWSHEVDASHLQIVGSSIMELSIFLDDVKSVHKIVACCPNLKSISSSNVLFLGLLVDACQLDEINYCHLGSLVKREKCEWTYRCKLKRTFEVNDDDETAVCLGEGKYYYMTSLRCWHYMTEEDSALLIPLMSHLTDLTMTNDFSFNILSAAVEKCRNLRKLHGDSTVDLSELRQLVLKSHDLRELRVSFDYNMKVDECVAAMSENCPLLEVCCLEYSIVTSESVMTELFRKCHYMRVFTASRWPVDALLAFAVNIDKLHLQDETFARKSNGRRSSLLMPSVVSTGVLCAVLAQNSGLRSIEISDEVENMPRVMLSIVQSCPHLTRFIISASGLHYVDSLASLGHLMHLSSLTIRGLKGFSIETFSAMLENKSSSLHTLTLRNCRSFGDMLAVIRRLCPALTSLNLDDNPDIENGDIVKLLIGCSKLEVLSLWGCYRITSEIVSSIKSPPMTSLNVVGTRITRSVLKVAFDGIKGFKYLL